MTNDIDMDFLRMTNITKRFPGVVALDNVSISVKKGEIFALVGENGAGKSTLMNILGGILKPDEGQIFLDGQPVTMSSPIEAYKQGIGFVHQESNLLDNLTVYENVFLGHEKIGKFLNMNVTEMCSLIEKSNSDTEYKLDPAAHVSSLTLAERQSVEITRAILGDPKILIFDEPTAALDEDEVNRLYKIIRRLKDKGVSIIYISHRLDEIIELADRVTVLKDGKFAGTLEKSEISKDRMISMMVGRVINDIYPDRSNINIGHELLKVDKLGIPGQLSDISFTVHAGEIVGLGGLEGQGQRLVARAIFGEESYQTGSISIDGQTLDRNGKIKNRINNGIAYVTHDRRGEGLVFTQSIRKNCSLPVLKKLSNAFGIMNEKEERNEVGKQMNLLKVKTSSMDSLVSHLSGGNQQKVMLSRWLMINPKILIIDEPTKGIDIGSRVSIYEIINDLTKQGIGILMLTSDMVELIGLSDRTLVFYEGKIMQELSRSEITEEKVMKAASGISEEDRK